MRTMMVCALALVIAVGGWYGWTAYESGQETKFAAQVVQSSAVQTERQLRARGEDGITFAEYFKRGAATVEALDQSITGLDTRTWDHKPTDRDVVVAFIEQCKASIRSDLAVAHLIMEGNNARESTDSAKKEFDDADSSVAREWANKRFQRVSSELIEILKKQIDVVKESTNKTKRLLAADESVKSKFGESNGLSKDMLDTLKKRIATEG
ncbi:hypothetical protein [Pseudomonas fluorescens]|uniref:Uncharacterized protein n=1 Tax=Pseudomonas fluorescens TaxID=294 RepID=A0A5E7ND85_PSEFL|nr:hypothetical protein [Pseudomonas fluorescens]VVP33983.1 hypothetical protein PS880_04486 [Pseudomonas fluorescens]